jgi:hypothetical protein
MQAWQIDLAVIAPGEIGAKNGRTVVPAAVGETYAGSPSVIAGQKSVKILDTAELLETRRLGVSQETDFRRISQSKTFTQR